MSGVQATSEKRDAFLGALGDLGDKSSPTDDPWTVTVQLKNQPVEFLIDTRTEVTVISKETWRQLGSPALSVAERKLKCPDANTLLVKGSWTGTVTIATQQAQ